jgi:16S rRNA G966 N2-methylase RsmD
MSAVPPSSFPRVTPAGQLVLDSCSGADAGVAVRRSSSLYRVHSYHTKVPPEAIGGFILKHTSPGDTVLDPFCGSGMTGIAAGMLGRRAILGDLSPAAVHIAHNYCTPCDPRAFDHAVWEVLSAVGEELTRLYTTRHGRRSAQIEYLVWSDIRRCDSCATEITLWDCRARGLRLIRCPSCGHEAPKSSLAIVGERAVEAHLTVAGERVVRAALPEDLRDGVNRAELPWIPTIPFESTRPMWRRGHRDLGIQTVADFYSARNLAALSLLWDAARRQPDARLRSALQFSLTAIANRASRRYQWNAKRPTNVLGGTLYVSSLRYEWNVLSLWRRKVRAVSKLFSSAVIPPDAVRVTQGDATALSIPSESIDYCFTDPPFGGHIVYSDSSLLWEAWLDRLTDREAEAIVVRGGDQPKTVEDYGHLLGGAFGEIRRVLKPHGKATVVFQASDPGTWWTMYEAAVGAGLHLAEVTTLRKGQPSFKQVKGQTAGELVAETDVVLTFSRKRPHRRLAGAADLNQVVRKISATVAGRGQPVTAGAIFAEVNARLLRGGARPVGIRAVHEALQELDPRAAPA